MLKMKNIQKFIHFHLLVQIWTIKQSRKKYIFFQIIWMHIRYVINQHHCDKIKNYPHVDH